MSKINYSKKLSILIPAYNVEKYIQQCLNSVNSQITDDCEVILYDDSSTDETLSLIEKHPITKYKNFKLIKGDVNKGLSYARNTLKSMSSGDYIWFLDSDDIILNGAVNKILCTFNNHDVDMILFNCLRWFELINTDGTPIGYEIKTYHKPSGYYSTDSSSIFCEILKNGNLHAPLKVFHKDLFIEGTEFPVGRIFEDINITPLLASLSKKIVYIDEPLYAYRHRSGSITSGMRPEDEIETLRSTINLRLRYEMIHGAICKDTLNAITYIASMQVRSGIKHIIKKANKKDAPALLQELTYSYKLAHQQNLINVLYTCFKNGGLGFAFQISRRLMQAKIIAKRNTI
ncbi:glycosyltransferase family 2 protein [Ochrobactrum sp. MR31]|nr:glycosyltransferase family 2 protein [Ochrobactrum sp. MR31]